MWVDEPTEPGYYWYLDDDLEEPTIAYCYLNLGRCETVRWLDECITLYWGEIEDKNPKFWRMAPPQGGAE